MLNKQVTFTVGLTTNQGAKLWPGYVIIETSKLLADDGIDGFTVTEHHGWWKGEPEESLSFVVVYDSNELPEFSPEDTAAAMAKQFHQDAVLYVMHGVFAELVGPPTRVQGELKC